MRRRLTSAATAFFLISAFAMTASATQTSSGTVRRAPTSGVQLAGLFGESDEEKAARLREDNQDAQIADLKQRIHDLEQSLPQITGQNEELSHRIQELSIRIDRQQKDFDYKLCSLAAQQLGAITSPDQSGNGLPCNPDTAMGTLAAPGGQMQGSGNTLGTLPQSAAVVSDTRPQFNAAMNLLAKAQYDEARAAFRTFVDSYPKDDLAPQAIYWVGDIAYVQKDYAGAAQAFAEGIKKYPTSSRGPDSMLKLGQSLLAMGQKKEGCLTLGAIKSKYSKASATVLSQAASARSTSCK